MKIKKFTADEILGSGAYRIWLKRCKKRKWTFAEDYFRNCGYLVVPICHMEDKTFYPDIHDLFREPYGVLNVVAGLVDAYRERGKYISKKEFQKVQDDFLGHIGLAPQRRNGSK